MHQNYGPRLFYPCTTINACIADREHFSLITRFSSELDEDERSWQLREFCTPLLLAVQLPENHFQTLDAHFGKLIPGAFAFHPSSLPASKVFADSKETLQAKNIIRRLPSTPQRMFSLPLVNRNLLRQRDTLWDGIRSGKWASKYLLPDARHYFNQQPSDDTEPLMALISKVQDVAWENFFVTTFIDTNSVVLAMKIAEQGDDANFSFAQDFLQYVNMLADLIDEYESLNDAASLLIMEPFSDPSPSVQELKAALFP